MPKSCSISEIKPLKSPTLDGLFNREVEVIDFLPNNEANPSYSVGSAAPAVAFDGENLLP
jgi:hypothetical protein